MLRLVDEDGDVWASWTDAEVRHLYFDLKTMSGEIFGDESREGFYLFDAVREYLAKPR